MKKGKWISMLIMALIIVMGPNTYAQRKTVKGSGNVKTEERRAGYFNTIKVSSGIDVYLKQGNKESIIVKADDNLLEYIETEIKGDVLKIYTDVNIKKAESKKVYVTIKDLKKLSASSAGDIKGEGELKTNELFLSASSAGDIEITVEALNINCDISSSGDIKINGTAEELEADLSSAGDLKAFGLKVQRANVSVSSAGDAKVFVTDELYARASSAGDIVFMGDAIVDGKATSAGDIRKR